MALPIPERLILSRSDGIGDVVLTLPMAVWLKEQFPTTRIIFLGSDYTKPVVAACSAVDEFINASQLADVKADAIVHVFPNRTIASRAKRLGIALRIGTSHRLYHWWTCNVRLDFSRKNSDLHEAQLNMKLLEPFTGPRAFPMEELRQFRLDRLPPLKENLKHFFEGSKTNVVLHPKSRASAREWSLQNYSKLIELLPQEQFQVFVTGSDEEGQQIKGLVDQHPHIVDLTGQLTLDGLIAFIAACDALVAASTGPLHIAGAAGVHAVGIFSSTRPIHPGRWAPLGPKAEVFVKADIDQITPDEIAARLMRIE